MCSWGKAKRLLSSQAPFPQAQNELEENLELVKKKTPCSDFGLGGATELYVHHL